ncbi:MAG TPA: ATP-binding cassette domain-containing protein [Caulobacteraceae bacterium]|jgi:ABC-2 type transport system ATP-binding protein|nr:ATP-binding cassette domain-containing protein [Caulobacteraceae bacterium]
MNAVTVKDLRKTFRRPRRSAGAFGALKGLIRPQFNDFQAVAGVSFQIAEGERVAIIGPNGAGKSTTLKMLCGVLEPTGGDAQVLGLTPWRQRQALAYRLGVVFGQRSQLWPELAARESFALLRRIYDQPLDVFTRRLGELCERFAIADLLDQAPGRMSLGQRMRCEIVASLLHGPDLLLLDEPTIGLDVTAKAAIRDFIRDEAAAGGRTVLLTSHDARDVELVCERVIVISAGRIVLDEPTEGLRRRFGARKLITFRSAARSIIVEMAGVTRRASEPHTTVLDVDTSVARVEAVVAAGLAQGAIEDVSVEDPPMEEVVHEIYAAVGV